MYKKVQLRRLVISLIMILLFGIVAIFNYGSGIYFTSHNIELSDISDVAIDKKGNAYVLNGGGYDAVRLKKDKGTDLVIKGLGIGEKSFERALHIAADDDGNIYIHNRIASDEALSFVGHENIKVYDKNGKYLYTSCDVDYEVPVLKTSIVALQNINGDVYAFSTADQAVLIENVKNGDLSMFKYKEADKYINSACYDDNRNCIYATTRNGKILMIDENECRILYSTAQGDTLSGLFTDICIDETGKVYVCDAKLGQVLAFENDELVPVFCPESVPYNLDYAGEFVYNETYSVAITEKGSSYLVDTTHLVDWAQFKSILFSIALFLVIISSVYPVCCVIKAIVTSKSSKIKLISGMTIVIAMLTLSVCMLVSKEYREILSEDILKRAELNAKLINNLMNPEDFKNLSSVTDFYSDSYKNIKSIVDNVILDSGTVPGDMYLIMYTLESDGTVVERYTLEEVEGCNYPYVWSDGVDEKTVYDTGKTFKLEDATDAEGSFLCVYSPVTDNRGDVVGVIEVGTDITIFNQNINKRLGYFALSIVALAAVIILLILEFIEYWEVRKEYSYKEAKKGGVLPPLKLYRIAVFMVFFVTNITTPFLSIYAVNLSDTYSSLTGFPAEILAAAPISAEVLFGAVFSMIGGNIIEKFGSRKAGLIGSIMFTVGLAIRFLYPDLLVLTVGNSIQGAGWGIVLLVINSRIAAEENEYKQEQGFTDYNVALQNGINSGIVLGGFLLSFANYTSMLVIATALSLIVLIFSYFYLYDSSNSSKALEEKELGSISYLKFILSPRVLVYFLCIVVPVIAASYYLNFLYPILGDRLGMSESIIGYSYLINGVVIICFGNIIVNFMSRFFGKKILLVIASLIYLVTFAVVGMFDSIPALLVSLVLLGISDSFGYVAQSTFYTDLKETKLLGYERAMGVYSLFENLSQSAGSFVFGYILTVGIHTGMVVYGVVIGASSIVFAIIVSLSNRRDKVKG